jgi:23S rRNA (cytidine1920-2'-O)/16S rRNA (cytidine1409-2'-O)-methyltransferase
MAAQTQRLDVALVGRGLVTTRSQAENYIKLAAVTVNGKVVTKTGQPVVAADLLQVTAAEQYVSRAALKLASVARALDIDFTGATVLDVGSSTGGFTDYALKHGAKKSIAVELGTDQLHPSLRGNPAIELHEQTDIRDFRTEAIIDIVVADVSFMSLRGILPSVARLCTKQTVIIAMVKPQFEAGQSDVKHKGVIKNDRMRRDILKDFEGWAQQHFRIIHKADSEVSGSRGNVERFYSLRKL